MNKLESKQSIYLALLSLTQIAASFIVNILVLRSYGINDHTDSFIAAQVIPLIIIGILTSALNSVWLPRLSASATNSNSWLITLSKSLGQTLLLVLCLGIVVLLLSEYLILVIFPGFEDTQRKVVTSYMSIFLVSMVFTTMSLQLTNALRTQHKFYEVELVNVIASLLMLPSIYFLSKTYELVFVCYILLFKSILIFTTQYFLAKRPRILIYQGISDKNAWRLMKPVLGGSIIYKFTPLIDKVLLSYSSEGVLTLFNMSYNLISAGTQVMEKSLIMTIYVKFGEYVNNKELLKLKNQVILGIKRAGVVSILTFLAMILFKKELISLLELILSSSHSTCEQIWEFSLLLIGLFYGSSAANLPINAQYALGNTKIVVKTGIYGFIFNVIIKLILFYTLEVTGLAIAISLHYLVNTLVHTLLFLKNEINSETRPA
jgi:peptidoglycan biosynthesis protein MviN/MurJ (putative lipid II flippase)